MQIALIIIAATVLALFAFCEIGLAYPVAWWLYLPVGITFAAGLIRPAPVRSALIRVGALVAVFSVIAALYFVEWTTRKPFLRALARVHPGMPESEVRQIMGRFMEGTGWQVPPDSVPSGGAGTLRIPGIPSQYAAGTSASGEMAIRDALVFRHSNEGAFNSDWAIISLSGGRVVNVEFSPD